MTIPNADVRAKIREIAERDRYKSTDVNLILSLLDALDKAEREIERLRGVVAKEPNTIMIAHEDGDHERLSRSIGNLEDKLDKATEALRPFAECASEFDAERDDLEIELRAIDGTLQPCISVIDLRRARAALSEIEGAAK